MANSFGVTGVLAVSRGAHGVGSFAIQLRGHSPYWVLKVGAGYGSFGVMSDCGTAVLDGVTEHIGQSAAIRLFYELPVSILNS